LFQVDLGKPNCNLTLGKYECPNEKNKKDEFPLETKDYIIIVLAITSFLLFVVLVMVGCYWIRKRKRKRNKDNTRPTKNFEINIQVRDRSLFISGEGPAKR
jgi:heme/copper-type cytochrome/quinol oxidase subunit 2